VYESKIKGQLSSSSNSHNVAFVSSDNSSNTNEIVNTAHNVFAASSKDQDSTASYADDVMFSFFSYQSNAAQLDNKDLEQINADDLEEINLKWQMTMLTMRVKRALRNKGNRNRDAPRRNAPVDTSTTNALVVQDGIGSSSSDFEVHTCSKECLQSYQSLQKQYDQQRKVLNKANLEIIGYQMGLESLEARIVVHEKNEAVYEGNIAFLKYDVQVKDISVKDLKNQLEEALKEKDDLKLKLENFEESSKNLTKLINSQISAKDKTCLGYDDQMNESELNMKKSEVVHSVFNSRESDVDDNPVNERFKTGEGFHAVPPPYTRNYMPPRPDLSFAGLDETVFMSTVRKTTTIVPETSISKTSKDIVEKPKSIQTKPKFTKINFVKSGENVNSVNKENTHRQVKYPRKSQSPRSNRRNWNGMMTRKLGNGFEFIKKACFVCGSFNHLIKDCDFHDNKMVEKLVLNNEGRVTVQRENRPVWNNTQRVNHQNKLTHLHPKRNFVLVAVLTKSGQVPVNAAKQSSHRAVVSVSTGRRVNTAVPKPKVNDALPITYSYFKAHSHVRRPFNLKSVAKTNKRVNTAKVNNVTTAGPKAVVSAAKRNKDNAVKFSTCWIWRPKGKGNPQYALQDQGIFDSGCSRHMTGNKFYLSDYQEIDGGFVAFEGSPKGGKITGKGKIRTGKLDFEAIYFVKELKFNLFSVSQMCDMKNSVLFTETECLVLSPDFKLLDESQVLLKVSRQNNMYSFDLKNVVPSGGSKPDWLFDIDLLTNSMKYKPVTAGNQTNRNAEDAVADDAGKKSNEKPVNKAELDNFLVHQKQVYANRNNKVSTASPSISAAGQSFDNANNFPTDPLMLYLEDTTDLLNTSIFSGAYDDEDVGAEADLNNLETLMNVSPIPTTKIHKDHPKEQIIGDPVSVPQIRRMTKSAQEHAMVNYIKRQRRTNHKDYQNCLFAYVFSQIEPKNVTQALTDPSWIEAMQDELL
ncbi:hypothetical protein Tco_1211963, partial [Tanacetum coccineum]